jgi:two-component system NtrC family sensor kinase
MVLIMILVSFTPLFLIAGIIGYSFETSYRDKVLAHLEELVHKHQQNIDSFLNEKLHNIGLVANSYTLEQLSDEAFLNTVLSNLQMMYGEVFVDLGVVNKEGKQVAYAGPYKLKNADYAETDWFDQAANRRYFISDVFLGIRHQPHFIVAVKQGGGGSEWILRSTIDFVAFNNLVESIHIGETGSAYILNKKGEFQTNPRLRSVPATSFLLDIVKEKQPERQLVETGAEITVEDNPFPVGMETEYKDEVIAKEGNYAGKDFVFVLAPFKEGEWMLVYQQEAADAFSDLWRTRKLALVIFLIGGLAIVVKTLLLSKRMVQRIEQADREKEMMNEQVIETGKLASVGELAAGIAHEINNPVAIMVEEAGWLEDLLEEEDFKESANLEEFKRALKQINTQGTRCKEITHKLLSFARKTDPKVRDIQINEMVEDIVSISEQRARYGNVKINIHLEPELPAISASPSELQQVFLNLINNAIDAIGTQGGVIDVTTRKDKNHVVVDVADNGQGIPQSILPRIFDPFFTTKPVGKGTGLGLSICYGIVKKMGGEITLNSAVGIGTTFHIHLPAPKGQEENTQVSGNYADAGQMAGT